MKSEFRLFALACLMGLSTISIYGQGSPATASDNKPPLISPEEQLIRATYEKLTTLSRAARHLNQTAVPRETPSDNDVLRFELKNFRIGLIQEILSSLHSELITGPTGEVVMLTRATMRLDNQEEQVAYKGRWTNGQYASVYDPKWTVADLFGFEPEQYYDVGEYALYDVVVSF